MVDTVRFLQHVDTLIGIKKNSMGGMGKEDRFINNLERLLQNVVKRLPEEEQFMWSGPTETEPEPKTGMFLFGSRSFFREFWEDFGYAKSFVHTGDLHIVVYDRITKLCGLEPDFARQDWNGSNCAYDLTLPFYAFIILTDDLADKSEDYIMGQIAYALSKMSCAWREMRNNQNVEPVEDKAVKDEARRLGFGKEIDVLEGSRF
jgi:hypothetical protein